MKKSPVVATVMLVAFVLLDSCVDQSFDSDTSKPESSLAADANAGTADMTADNPFQKNVGSPIDRNVGLRWIDNYRQSGSAENSTYLINADALRAIVKQENCNGISLKYAFDADYRLHIIPVGIDAEGIEMNSGQAFTREGIISWIEAKEMCARFDGSVRSHYFGVDTYNRLLEDINCVDVLLTYARDDKGNPQLLLSAANDIDPESYEDSSAPCPTVCPKSY